MATIDSLIAAKRAKIAGRVASESDLTDEIIKDLAQLKQAGLDANGAAPTVVDSASIGSGIDSSTDIDAIKALLTNILGELVNSKAFADVVVQDSVKTPFIRREEVDQTTGLRTIRIENFDGSLGAPVGAIVPIKSGGDSIIEDQYYAKAAGSGFSLGDSLSSLKVVDEARTVTLLGWFNITTQSVIAAPPTTAIKGYEDLIEELLSKLITQLPATLGAKTAASSLSVALATDTTLPLPPGAATEANQDEEILALEAIGSSVALAATESTLIDIENRLIAIETNTLAPSIRPLSPATDGVTVESTVLATTVKQDEQKAALDLIDGKLDLVSTESTLLAVRDKLAAIEANTLAPNSRPLTPAVDAVRVESATLATVSKQDEQKAVLDAIDQKLALASTAGLQSTAIDKLNQILIELSKQKEFEDLIVQDTVGTAFVRREVLNESTNARTITIENFDGTVGAPVGAVTVVKQIKGNNIVTRNYYAKIAGADFAAGDSLSTMQIVNGETNVVTMLGWFNITQQTSIAAPPTAAIEGYEDRNEELLSAIRSALPATLGTKPSAGSLAVALASDTVLPLPINAATESTLTQLLESLGTLADISLPASAFDEATDKGLFRLIAKLITEASAAEIAALGEALETDLIGSPGDFGSLKAVTRGAWYDTQNILGSTGDVTTGGIFDAGSVKMLIRALGLLITNGEQITRIYDPVTEQRASITNPTQRATNEPALVVAISPDTPIDINQLPGSIQADIAAIRTNTANISRYQFNLAQTAAGVVFLVRTDGVAGTTTALNYVTGAVISPGAPELTDPIPVSSGSTKLLEINEYVTKTTVAGQWVVGDLLTRVIVFDSTNNTVSTPIWQNPLGAVLTTVPLLGIDVGDGDLEQINLLKSIDAQLKNLPQIVTDLNVSGGTGLTVGPPNVLATSGLSQQIVLSVSVMPAGTTMQVTVQDLELGNLHVFDCPTTGIYKSPNLKVSGAGIGYARAILGPGSVNYKISRIQSQDSASAGEGPQDIPRSPSFAQARQVSTTFVTTAAANNNVLDSTGLGKALDVRDYNSAEIVVTTAGTSLTYSLQSSLNAAFTQGVSAVPWINNNGGAELGSNGVLPAGQVFRLSINLANISYLNLRQVIAGTGISVTITLSQAVNASRSLTTLAANQTLASVATVGQISDAAASSTISALGTFGSTLALNGRGVAAFGVGGTWVGTLQAQLSIDGVDWYNITGNNAIYDLKNKIFNNNGNITVNGLYQINVGGLGQVRLISTVWTSGTATVTGRASSASSLIAIEGQVNAQISNTNLLVRSDSVSNSSDLSGTITTTTSSITFSQTWGISRATEINITGIAPGTSYTCEWQEPVGTGWRTVYRFETTSNTGVRRSPLLPNINNNWRYLETISGATPSVTRSITRTQSNLAVNPVLNTNQLGGFNFSDLAVAGRTRAITANNNSAVKLFLQVHDKATLLVTGDTPINGRVYPIAPGGVVALGVGDLGPNGTQLGLNTRLALSTAFSVWVSPVAVSAPNQTFSLHAEVI
jgi:hypothetical protein